MPFRTFSIVVLIFGLFPFASQAAPRSMAERAAFVRHNPCPATGLRRGSCPGWEVDHVVALCGEVFPVTKAAKPGSPVCPECKQIYERLKKG